MTAVWKRVGDSGSKICYKAKPHKAAPAFASVVTPAALGGSYSLKTHWEISMPHQTLRALSAACLLALAGCGTEPNPPVGGDAELRLLHATADLGPLDVYIGDVRVIQGVTYGNTSAIAMVPDGQQHLVVRSGSTSIGELDATLSPAHINAVTVAAGVPQLSSTVIPDTGAVATNRANIRLVNVVGPTTADPTLLHVLVNFPGVSPDSTARLGLDTKIASYGTLMYFDPGHFRFRFVPQNTTTVLTEVEFDVAAGEKKAVVLERAADGSYHAQVVVEQ
jgi:hypothetical protein